jgi:hypothetical protein
MASVLRCDESSSNERGGGGGSGGGAIDFSRISVSRLIDPCIPTTAVAGLSFEDNLADVLEPLEPVCEPCEFWCLLTLPGSDKVGAVEAERYSFPNDIVLYVRLLVLVEDDGGSVSIR